MAEYYPLLAKAVGSLPNSTPDSRRVVYERARKALIGQLRTLHPPIPDDDIERESVALDRAIERLESELAVEGISASEGSAPPSDAPKKAPVPKTSDVKPAETKSAEAKPQQNKASPNKPAQRSSAPSESTRTDTKPPEPVKGTSPPIVKSQAVRPAQAANPSTGSSLKSGENRPSVPLRTKVPKPSSPKAPPSDFAPVPPPSEPALPVPAATTSPLVPQTPAGDLAIQAESIPQSDVVVADADVPARQPDDVRRLKPPRTDPQRPIAPQPPVAKGPKRRLWIIPAAIGVVVAVVAFAAWKLRDRPETIAHGKSPEQTQADSGKIAERVGGPASPPGASTAPQDQGAPQATQDQAAQDQGAQDHTAPTAAPTTTTQSPAPTPANPEVAVAHRAALLVEAPDEPNKVKTFLGTVVWKLNNVPQGPNDAVGVAVEADIDLPDDKMKAIVTFAKNTEASLPASHTINIRYSVDPGSFTGDVKQISVPQMRPESSPSGEPLAGVTVQIVPNSFLVGLSPGNAETANTDLIRRLQWIDIPMLLDSGKIAKLTFEKSDSGQRDLSDALDAWQKQ